VKKSAAVAVFVKTPGFSPVKTRLSASLGIDEAEAFYRLSVQAMVEILRDVQSRAVANQWDAYWAVAEAAPECHSQWHDFPVIPQGDGELGQRLAAIYSRLLQDYQQVVLVGGDCPQLSAQVFEEAQRLARDGSFVLGPARDGGFYLLLGQTALPPGFWESIPYSVGHTMETLVMKLMDLGHSVRFLPHLSDVDQVADLAVLGVELSRLGQRTRHQEKICDWLRQKSYG